MLVSYTISPTGGAFYYQNRMPMGDIDTQFLKLYADDDLLLNEVVQEDAELLMLDTWLMETIGN